MNPQVFMSEVFETVIHRLKNEIHTSEFAFESFFWCQVLILGNKAVNCF